MNKDCTARNMTLWYRPLELLRTGVQVAISKVISSRADARVLESLTDHQNGFDYSNKDEVIVDFIADTGDGFNPAFTVARATASMKIPGVPNKNDIIVMGGDQVYPVASLQGYKDRFELPYKKAYADVKEKPTLYAIPGNHDWYDGLVQFRRLFCQKQVVGSLPSEQTRSYFSLKLPGGWWLFGIDIQLGYSIDRPQLRYFQTEALSKMSAGDKVILCVSDPVWAYDEVSESNLEYFEKLIEKEGGQVCLWLAGDLHYYRHHENSEAGLHKIVSGGGGAFLHATHPNKETEITVNQREGSVKLYEKNTRFPSNATSKRLSWRTLLFPVLNPWFGTVTSFLYLIVSWILCSVLGNVPFSFSNAGNFVYLAAHELAFSPGGVIITIITVLILYGFAYFGDGKYKLIRAVGHTIAHLSAASVTGWLAAHFFLSSSASHMLLSIILGWVVGCFIFGLYLFISVRYLGSHANEAFSAIRVQDYKNFLRISISHEGRLVIYPIGIPRTLRVKKWWKPLNVDSISLDSIFTQCSLIENPIVINSPRSS